MTDRRILALCLALLLPACSEDEIETTTRNFDRAWDVALLCAVQDATTGLWRGTSMDDCGEEGEGSLHAFVVQSTPGSLGAVNLRTRRMLDLDPREPLPTSIDVGPIPAGIDAAPDGHLLLIALLGDPPPGADGPGDPGLPYLAAVDPADVLPSVSAPPGRIPMPAPSSAVMFLDDTTAVVTLPALSAVALVRLASPASASVVDAPVPLGSVPSPDGDGGSIEGLPTPWALAYDAARGRVLVGDRNLGKLAVLTRDGDGGLVLERVVDVAGPPVSIAVEPGGRGPAGDEAGRWIYMANGSSGGVVVMDAETFEPLDLAASDPMEWRWEIVVSGMVREVMIGRIEQPETTTATGPTILYGTFAFLVSTRGEISVVDIEDDSVDDEGPICWSGENPGEGDYTCRRHVLRSAVESDGPYWGALPRLYLPSGTPVVYVETPDDTYPRFAGWGATDENERATYGVTFDADERRAVSQTWAIEYEARLPWTDGVGGNVESDGSFSDRAMPFCDRGVLGEGGGYAGDRLVVLDGPNPLEGTTPDCSAYGAVGGEATLEYRIVEAWQGRLVLASVDGGPPLPNEECFPYATHYEIRASGQWVVVGSSTGFLHHGIAGDGGRCRNEPEDCSASPEELRCLHTSRATEGVPYANPWISFTLQSGTSATPRGLRWDLAARGGFDALGTSVAAMPVAGTLDLTGRTGPAALVVDAGTEGLSRVSLRGGFGLTDTWE